MCGYAINRNAHLSAQTVVQLEHRDFNYSFDHFRKLYRNFGKSVYFHMDELRISNDDFSVLRIARHFNLKLSEF